MLDGMAVPTRSSSVLMVEALATLHALALAKLMKFDHVSFETDSKILCDGIKGAIGNRIWTIYPLIQEIRKVSYAFPHIEWNWIPRKRNRAAHVAASIGARAVELESWVNRPPPSMMRVLISDGLPCPLLISFNFVWVRSCVLDLL
ncbi:unnamed protein product [Prunus brigantina]